MNQYGEIVYSETDLCNLAMRGINPLDIAELVVENVNTDAVIQTVERSGNVQQWNTPESRDISIADWDAEKQKNWHMPEQYQQLDIAKHILDLCDTPEQLQRAGHELMLYQEKNLFTLLKYLKYLVDTMKEHQIIWGVGRGSSVASYVLYLLEVHKIDSMYYDLSPEEFLR